jgi:hypothetical protein
MKLVPALHIVAAEIKGAPISVTYVSDMYKGMLDGRTVAVKCLRVFDGEAEKIRQVTFTSNYHPNLELMWSTGSCSPSAHLATPPSY